MRLFLLAALFSCLLPASAVAASVPEQFDDAARGQLISWAEAEQAKQDFQKLSLTEGRDWQQMADIMRRLAARNALKVRAPMFIHSLRVFAVKGDRPIGERVNSGPAAVVQRYAGLGWQLMPLASASRVNALAGGSYRTDNVLLASQALRAMLVRRGSSYRFEYPFVWWGRQPGWISGMTQTITASALARMFERTGDRRWGDYAYRALAPVKLSAPKGTSLSSSSGLRVLLYPWRKSLNVMNAQLWSTWALAEVSQNVPGGDAGELYERAATQSLSDMRGWQSGNDWTLYASGSDPLAGRPASREYHYLSVQALRRLCVEDDRFCVWADRFGGSVPGSVKRLPAPGSLPLQ